MRRRGLCRLLASALLGVSAGGAGDDQVVGQLGSDNGSTVYRISFDASDPQRTLGLAIGAAVGPGCPTSGPEALTFYRGALAADVPGRVSGMRACLVTAGPQLDGPDSVAVGNVEVSGDELRLTIDHTSVRRLGKELLRNLPWRPLVVVPLPTLRPDRYALRVTWQAVVSLREGQALPDGTNVVSARFNVADHG